ncbi:MAG: cupin domain-containing protein [Anaerolineae bacterium]|nr:cupin domain-containing protein [Anaerolineae bacterium]
MKLKHTTDIAVDTSHSGTVKRKALLRGADTGPDSNILSMNEAYLDPGREVEEHQHQDAEEIFFILGGRGTMLVDDEPVPLAAGNLLLIEPGERHLLRNNGADPLTFVTVLVKRNQMQADLSTAPSLDYNFDTGGSSQNADKDL